MYNFLSQLKLKLNEPLQFVIEGYTKELDKLPLYVNVTVGNLLFRGYQDLTTSFFQRLKSVFRELNIRYNLPKIIGDDGRFSLLNSVSSAQILTSNCNFQNLSPFRRTALISVFGR